MDHSQTGQIGAGSPSFGGVSSASPSSVLLSDLLRYDISRLRPPISNSVAYPVELAAGPAMASSAPTLSWTTRPRPAVRHHKHFKGKFGTALIHCKQFSSDIPCRHPCHRLRPSGPRVGAGVEAGRPWVEESYNSRVS